MHRYACAGVSHEACGRALVVPLYPGEDGKEFRRQLLEPIPGQCRSPPVVRAKCQQSPRFSWNLLATQENQPAKRGWSPRHSPVPKAAWTNGSRRDVASSSAVWPWTSRASSNPGLPSLSLHSLMASRSCEVGYIFRDPAIADAHIRQWAQIAARSEDLDWTSESVDPQWRLGS